MKILTFALLVISLLLSGCGEDQATEEFEPEAVVATDSIPTIKGEFIFLADAAVLKGKDFIYGVQIDSISRRLADTVEPLKRDEFDMVEVTVKAKVVQNPGQNGWDELVQIREILEIPKRKGDSLSAPKVTKDINKP
ncbi:hypothetical protein [Salinimicrobium sp. HB62]|uniref:hypothetical protein n=1 Tax=Salinimicrobium sp. HB62 TaxID=3077781 RepID=UPI002D776BE0|nr:hypothetical protein [Salinimicrobium sp. HB62]